MKKLIYVFLVAILFCSFAIVDDLAARVYYVDNRHPQTSDSNTGTITAPLMTIQHAADILLPGDICLVSEGDYSERIVPARSGQSGNPITFKANGTVKILGFQLANRQYIRIIGFEFTHANSTAQYEAISMASSDGCEILDNYFHHTSIMGIWMRQSAATNNTLISGNRFAYMGSVPGSQIGDLAIFVWGDNNIVEYNDISHVGDFLNVWGKNNVIRNNYFHDCYYTDFPDYRDAEGHHVDVVQYWSDARMILSSTLMENNLIMDNVIQHAHVVLLQNESNTTSSHFIFRNNVMARIGSYPFSADHMQHIKVYHNTFVDVLSSQTPKAYYCVSLTENATSGCVINNIFYNSARDGGYVYHVDSQSLADFIGDYNLAFNSEIINATWTAPIRNEAHGILNRDPLFLSYANNDFHLHSQSPGVNAAGPLTTTVSSGSGHDVAVRDARCFFKGSSQDMAEYIRVGVHDTLRITEIDYTNNTIRINREITWGAGDNVSLIYRGAGPDIGAFEFDEMQNSPYGVQIVSPADNSTLHGAIKMEVEAINFADVRKLVVFIDGLPQLIMPAPEARNFFMMEGLSLGRHEIEIRAYARHATATLSQGDKITLTVAETSKIPPAAPVNVRLFIIPD